MRNKISDRLLRCVQLYAGWPDTQVLIRDEADLVDRLVEVTSKVCEIKHMIEHAEECHIEWGGNCNCYRRPIINELTAILNEIKSEATDANLHG